jgi:hypothetical protein
MKTPFMVPVPVNIAYFANLTTGSIYFNAPKIHTDSMVQRSKKNLKPLLIHAVLAYKSDKNKKYRYIL